MCDESSTRTPVSKIAEAMKRTEALSDGKQEFSVLASAHNR
jgi:hypothetical protein